jgi:hypothetical protein
MLGRDPRIFFPEEKELHFFSSYSDFPVCGRLEADGFEPYREQFAGAKADQICGEATPNYLFDEGACGRIRQVLPDARLLVILRDPVARAWSHYWHQVRRGREKLGFEEALEAEEKRLASGDPNRRTHFSYLARGRYVEGLRRYVAHFERDQLCVVFLEDLRREPRLVVERVRAHLGLTEAAPDVDVALGHANRSEYPRWPRLDTLTRRVRRWAEKGGPALAGPARAIGRATRPLRVYSGAPRMKERTREHLKRALAPADQALADWLGAPPPWMADTASAPDSDGS